MMSKPLAKFTYAILFLARSTSAPPVAQCTLIPEFEHLQHFDTPLPLYILPVKTCSKSLEYFFIAGSTLSVRYSLKLLALLRLYI